MSHAVTALSLLKLGFKPHVLVPNGKRPVATGWQSESLWTAEAVRNRFEAAPDGANIGVRTGDGLIVIDVDAGEGKVGPASLARLTSALGPLPRTVSAVTRSGGSHFYFKVPSTVANSASKLAQDIDIRGEGGQAVVPPSTVDTGEYRWAFGQSPAETKVAELPQAWWAAVKGLETKKDLPPEAPASSVLRAPGDRAFAKKRAALYLAKLDPSVAGDGGHNALFNAACRAVELCLNADDALEVVREYNARSVPPWEDHELARKVREALKLYKLGSRFDAGAGGGEGTAAGAAADGGAVGGPPASNADAPLPEVLAWVEQMQSYVTHDRNGITWDLSNPLGERAAVGVYVAAGVPAPTARAALKDWLMPYAKYIDCDPDKEPQFRDEAGSLVLNNYVPPTVLPVEGPFPTLDEVLSFVTCGDPEARRWLVNWMAHAYQNPARAMRTVPVLYGAQKTGKSLVARMMTTLIGEENSASIRNDDIKSRFNAHYVAKLFVTVGEIEAGEVTHATSTLKWLTGEPTLMAESKGITPFQVKNRVKLLCTSNQTLPVNLEGEADTRWCLFKQLTPPTPEYAKRCLALFTPGENAWSTAGMAELRGLAYYLLAWKVDEELVHSVYKNDARTSAVAASRTSTEQFVDAVLDSSIDAVWAQNVPEHEKSSPQYAHMDIPQHPEQTGCSAVYATYRAFCRASGLQALGTGRFPGELERVQPTWTRSKALASAVATRPWVYYGLPRQRELRSVYLPQGRLFDVPLPPAVVATGPEAERVQRVMDAVFGEGEP